MSWRRWWEWPILGFALVAACHINGLVSDEPFLGADGLGVETGAACIPTYQFQDRTANEDGFIIERLRSGITVLDTLLMEPGVGDTLAYVDANGQEGDSARITAFRRSPAAQLVSDTLITLCRPTDLSASAFDSTTIDLTWVDNSAREDSVHVYHCLGPTSTCDVPGDYSEVLVLGANQTGASVTGLQSDTIHSFVVRVQENGVTFSAYSNEASDSTPAAIAGIAFDVASTCSDTIDANAVLKCEHTIAADSPRYILVNVGTRAAGAQSAVTHEASDDTTLQVDPSAFSTFSYTATQPAATNRILAFSFGGRRLNTNSGVIDSVKYGGTKLTSVTSVANGRAYAAVWRLLESSLPGDGDNTLEVWMSDDFTGVAVVASWYSNVDQGSPTGTPVTGTGTGTSSSVSVSSATDARVVDAIGFSTGPNTLAADNDQNVRTSADFDGNGGGAASDSAGAATVAMGWSWSNSVPFAHVGLSLNQGTGSADVLVDSITYGTQALTIVSAASDTAGADTLLALFAAYGGESVIDAATDDTIRVFLSDGAADATVGGLSFSRAKDVAPEANATAIGTSVASLQTILTTLNDSAWTVSASVHESDSIDSWEVQRTERYDLDAVTLALGAATQGPIDPAGADTAIANYNVTSSRAVQATVALSPSTAPAPTFAVTLDSLAIGDTARFTVNQLPAFPGAMGHGAIAMQMAYDSLDAGTWSLVVHLPATCSELETDLESTASSTAFDLILPQFGGTCASMTWNPVSDFVMLAGQVAPGDGLLVGSSVAGGEVCRIADVTDHVWSYVRCFPGRDAGSGNDAGIIKDDARRIYLHHIECGFGNDEQCSIKQSAAGDTIADVTVAWSIIAWAFDSCCQKAMIINPDQNQKTHRISLYWNVWSAKNRNPVLNGNDTLRVVDMRSCVVYNWSNRSTDIRTGNVVPGLVSADIRDCYYKEGPHTTASLITRIWDDGDDGVFSLYYEANKLVNSSGGVLLAATDFDWDAVAAFDGTTLTLPDPDSAAKNKGSAFSGADLPTFPIQNPDSAQGAYDRIVPASGPRAAGINALVGCDGSWGNRADINTVLADTMLNRIEAGEGTEPADESGYGGFPTLAAGTACTDSDSDGLPDAFETDMVGSSTGLAADTALDRRGWPAAVVYAFAHRDTTARAMVDVSGSPDSLTYHVEGTKVLSVASPGNGFRADLLPRRVWTLSPADEVIANIWSASAIQAADTLNVTGFHVP